MQKIGNCYKALNNKERMMDCKNCDFNGDFCDGQKLSNCCNSKILDDSDLCSKCKEHCISICDECKENECNT